MKTGLLPHGESFICEAAALVFTSEVYVFKQCFRTVF